MLAPHGVREILLSCFFFFQAEDGIRDLVRSRGLGDVYKRQARGRPVLAVAAPVFRGLFFTFFLAGENHGFRVEPVSYTHLTLPTSDLV